MSKKKRLKLRLKRGALHEALGVSDDKKIPSGNLADKPGDSALMKKRKNFAKVAAHWKK